MSRHHHDDHCREPREHRRERCRDISGPESSCHPIVPIHGGCMMTPCGPVCIIRAGHGRMR
jgi:hypothetical protein